jgi:hypothetical protein
VAFSEDVALPEDGEQELEADLPEFLFAVEHGHAGRGVVVDAADFEMKIGEALVRDFEGREAGTVSAIESRSGWSNVTVSAWPGWRGMIWPAGAGGSEFAIYRLAFPFT